MARASFKRPTMPANVGLEADVPPMRVSLPPINTRYRQLWVETSG